MRFANAQFAKVLRRTVLPVAVAVLGLILFSQVARTGDDANAIPVRLIVLNSAEDAQAVLDRLKAGDDFAVLAREQSVDPTSIDGGLPGKDRSHFAAGRIERCAARSTTGAAFEDRQNTIRLRRPEGLDGYRDGGSGDAEPRPPGAAIRRPKGA